MQLEKGSEERVKFSGTCDRSQLKILKGECHSLYLR